MDALNRLSPHAHWFLRVALASVFLYHGLTKFPALGMMAEMMDMPVAMVGMLATAETLAGVFILAGGVGPDWMTRVAGAIIAVVMIGAISMVHWEHGWNSVNMEMGNEGRGMEFQVTLLLMAVYFVVVGNRGATDTQEETRPDEAARPHETTPHRREAKV